MLPLKNFTIDLFYSWSIIFVDSIDQLLDHFLNWKKISSDMLLRTGRIEVWEKGLGGKNHVDWWLGANVGVTCLLGVVVNWGLLAWESQTAYDEQPK